MEERIGILTGNNVLWLLHNHSLVLVVCAIVSDSCFNGINEDKSGPNLRNVLLTGNPR